MISTRMLVAVGLPLGLLTVPLIAMQFTDEVVWTATDFVVAGALLLSTGLVYERLTRSAPTIYYHIACALALLTALLLVWVSLAVGIIGNEGHPANWMFAGVLVLAVVGSLLARFKVRAMARALYATALLQFVAALLIVGGWVLGISGFGLTPLLVCGMFLVMWLGSAALFGLSDRMKPEPRT